MIEVNMMKRPAPKFADPVVAKIRATRGLSVRIAEACGIERSAVYQWTRVPVEQVHTVAEVLKLTPERIRPDIFKARVKGPR